MTAKETLSIEQVTVADAPWLADLAARSFAAAFAEQNDPDDLRAYIEEAFSRERIAHEIETDGSSFFVARIGGEPAGYLKLNRGEAQTERVEGDTLEIERIYVDEAWQGHGVGKALMDFALSRAREAGCEALWLGVWENNFRALEFYRRYGFEQFGEHHFQIGKDLQRDLLLRLPL